MKNNNYISFTGPRDLGKIITDVQLRKDLKELDDCVKNMSFEEKIKSIMRHSFNVRDDGELMTFKDWVNSPEDVEQVFGEMVASLKMWLILDKYNDNLK